MSYQHSDEPIYALATPLAESAIAVIRTSGEGVIERVGECFSRPERLLACAGHTAVTGEIIYPRAGVPRAGVPREGDPIDQVVCTVYRAPKSYTGEDAVEISTHGSIAVVRAVLNALSAAGLRQAEPGEFTLRAFLAGKMGLTQAEAVGEIVRARTDTSRRLALGRLAGSLERKIDATKQQLVRVLAGVQIQLDYPEEETGEIAFATGTLESSIDELRKLLSTWSAGRLYQTGVSVALCGATNAGKSSLFNRLLSEDRSIVSDTHGTTRDFIEAAIDIEGIPVRLYDTAGIREIGESVEREGIRRTHEVIDRAAAVLYIVDSIVGITDDERQTIESLRASGRLIGLWNKVDVSSAAGPPDFIATSAESGAGLDAVRSALVELFTAGAGVLSGDETVIDNTRQANLVTRAAEACERCLESVRADMPADIVAVDLQDAVDALAEITGEVTRDDILDAMFADFCVGK